MKYTDFLGCIFLSLILVTPSCSRQLKEAPYTQDALVMEESAVSSPVDYSPVDFISSSAATVTGSDSTRRFIRTADLRFKTKDVIKATYAIEDIIARHDGFVASSELKNTIDQRQSVRISRDSTLESTFFNIVNQMELRIPYRKLDTALKEIALWADFIEYRRVSAVDVRLNMMRNELTRKRAARQEKRLADAIDEKGQKLNQIADAEDKLSLRQEQADEALVSNLEIQDKVNYSTISIYLWQDRTCKRVVKANEDNIDEYRPGMGIRLINAIQTGWQGLISFIVFLTHFWVLWLSGMIIFMIIRIIRIRKKTKSKQ